MELLQISAFDLGPVGLTFYIQHQLETEDTVCGWSCENAEHSFGFGNIRITNCTVSMDRIPTGFNCLWGLSLKMIERATQNITSSLNECFADVVTPYIILG